MTVHGANVIAVDVGGTHTDAALLDSSGRLHVEKVRSTPADPGIAFVAAIEGLLSAAQLRPDEVAAVVHGTTVATNAVITGSFARVGLIVTRGFEDMLSIGTQQRTDLYDPWLPKPEPIVPRHLVHGVRERMGADGVPVRPLCDDDVREAAQALRGRVDAIAVVLLFSFSSPRHEREIARILADELPGVPVSLSSEVAPEFREYPRAATTVLNAALLPETGGYLARLEATLRERGMAGAFQLMTSAGGVIPARLAARLPVALLVSGPAGGAVAAAALGAALGAPDVLMLDVGGTSADIAVITAGEPRRRYRGEVAGMPVSLPQIDVLPIGAGGGSIAAVDDFGSLRVGPLSAGAVPGPAAYGTGDRATVTDAHIVLGSIDPAGLLGGRLPLDARRARDAVRAQVADPLGIEVEKAAGSIIRIADAKMADALRAMTIARGVDVRGYALMAFGGAGPLHACAIAEDLGIARVLVPRHPGLTSALGLLMGDGRYDVARTHVAALRDLDLERVETIVASLTSTASELLATAGVEAELTMRLDADVRYAGQAYELTVPVSDDCSFGPDHRDALEHAFVQAHRDAYGHAWQDSPIELVTLRVRAGAPRASGDWIAEGASAAAPGGVGHRIGWDADGESVRYRVLDRTEVLPGLSGPAIVTQPDTTTLIPAGWRVADVHGAGMTLTREAGT